MAHLLASIAVVGVSSLLGRPDRVGQLVNQLQAKNECDQEKVNRLRVYAQYRFVSLAQSAGGWWVGV